MSANPRVRLPLFFDREKSNACELFPSLLLCMNDLIVYTGDCLQNIVSDDLTVMNNIACDPFEICDVLGNPFYDLGRIPGGFGNLFGGHLCILGGSENSSGGHADFSEDPDNFLCEHACPRGDLQDLLHDL